VITGLKLWSGITLNQYEFTDYVKGNTSYSGNQLTGTPKQVLTGGIDLTLIKKIHFYVTANHTSEIPLNDANSVFAKSYTLISSRASYKSTAHGNLPFELFAGADNLLDQTYSLGNDLNAAGGRYFNAAPRRNYYFGIKLGVDFSAR
jgi:iron complex outermembrane recepter protein